MDIILLAQDVTWSGRTGDAVHVRELVRHLALRGHAIRVVARGEDTGPLMKGVEIHPIRSSLNLGFAFVRRPLVARILLRIASQRRPDVVYSRSFGDPVEAVAARVLGLPIVYEVNGDAIAERESLLRRTMSAAARRRAARSARRGFRQARLVVAVTETLRRLLVEEYGIAAENVRVVPNAVDCDRFIPKTPESARSTLGLPAHAPVVAFVGNLVAWQGVQYLLRSHADIMSRHPDALLLIVGDGQMAAELRALARTLGIERNVSFTGAVPHDEVAEYVAAADVCVAPMTHERLRSGSSAVKIHEYLACERPVVASRIPGLEFVEEEGLGRLVPVEDPAALAMAIDELLLEPVRNREAGRRGRAYVLRKAGWSSVATAIEDVCGTAVTS